MKYMDYESEFCDGTDNCLRENIWWLKLPGGFFGEKGRGVLRFHFLLGFSVPFCKTMLRAKCLDD